MVSFCGAMAGLLAEFALLTCLSNSCFDPLPENVALELGKHRQQSRHRPPPAFQSPNEEGIQLPPSRLLQQLVALRALNRAGTDFLDFQHYLPLPRLHILTHRLHLQR